MTDKKLSERLRALASREDKRSKASRLNDVIDDIETALAAGVSYETVVAELNDSGFEISFTTFKTTLQRIRAKRGKTAKPAVTKHNESSVGQPPLNAKATPAQNLDEETEQSRKKPSRNPADIDKILRTKPDLDALAKAAKAAKTEGTDK